MVPGLLRIWLQPAASAPPGGGTKVVYPGDIKVVPTLGTMLRFIACWGLCWGLPCLGELPYSDYTNYIEAIANIMKSAI